MKPLGLNELKKSKNNTPCYTTSMSSNIASHPTAESRRTGLMIIAFAGLSCMGLGLYTVYSDWRFSTQTEQATGTVVRVHSSLGRKSLRSYAPEVTFTTAANEMVTFTNPMYHSGANYRVGDAITVHYPAGEPEQARVSAPILGFPLWSFALGLFFFVLSIIGLRQKTAFEANPSQR